MRTAHAGRGAARDVRIDVLGGGRFRLSGELRFANVMRLRDQAARLFADHAELWVELRRVERADSAGLALLVQWAKDAAARRRPIHFVGLPPQMLAIAQACGLDRVLRLE